jgi:hypothetical protein
MVTEHKQKKHKIMKEKKVWIEKQA